MFTDICVNYTFLVDIMILPWYHPKVHTMNLDSSPLLDMPLTKKYPCHKAPHNDIRKFMTESLSQKRHFPLQKLPLSLMKNGPQAS